MRAVFNHTLRRGLVLNAILCLVALQVNAQEEPARNPDPAEVLAYQGAIVLTQQEIDAAFSKLPEAERLLFIRDGAKVDQLIGALLKRKALAADARAADYDRQPLVATRMRLEAEKELADAWLQQVVNAAPEADYEVLAHEDYLLNPDSYRTPETLDVSHILIGISGRSSAEARLLVESLESRLREDPSSFDALLTEYSDDPARADNGGRYPDMQRGMMVAPFEEAAFALQRAGDISPPVKTKYGWHLIRLNGRTGDEIPEFSEVRDAAVARAQRRYRETYRERYLQRVLSDPIVMPEGAADIMARRHFGENLERAPAHRP